MHVLKMYCVCLLLFLPFAFSIPYPANRCYKNDCFYKLTDSKIETCKIYNTSICLDFYKSEESSEWALTSEEESNFRVSIVPYSAEFVKNLTMTSSAINFTFTINNTEINELVVKVFKKGSSKPICRVFDFQNVNTNKNVPIYLFYDCLFGMVERGMKNVHMDFIALPGKAKLSYYVFIPDSTSCSCQSLIMIFSGSLQNGVVQVKFSQAPLLYNVSSYAVKLIHYPSGDEKLIEVSSDVNRTMLFAHFSSVNEGVYSVLVKPVTFGLHDNCSSETELFFVENPKSDRTAIIYLCVFILLFFSSLVFLKIFRRNIIKARFSSKRHVLLLYSYDCEEHKEFVKSWIDYLKENCHVKVSTIYDELPKNVIPNEKAANAVPNVVECDPKEWIQKKYLECDRFMFLISAGLFYTLDSENHRNVQQGHEWRYQLSMATTFILDEQMDCTEDIKRKRICKVRFKYSSKDKIPNRLQPGFGKCFVLPENMNDLMNFMHDSSECFLCNKFCDNNFESEFESTDLCKKMKAVQAAVDNNTHIRFIQPLDDVTMNCEIPVLNEPINFDSISESSDENSDTFVMDVLLGSNEDVEFAKDASFGDSDSEESDLLCNQQKFCSENEMKCVLEGFLSKN